MRKCLIGLASAVMSSAAAFSAMAAEPWTSGPAAEAAFFPIGVWVQEPGDAERYKAAGINTYVGLWNGPTEEHLAKLKQAGMYVICHQNEVGLAHRDDPMILAWLLKDEPDNAQPKIDPKTGKQDGWDRCIPPATVLEWYAKAKAADPTRPVMVNFGMGMVDLKWPGRGVGAKQTDYLEYVKGGDIVSFDIYPVAHYGGEDPPLHRVGDGVRLLHEWTGNQKPVWTVIECTAIHDHARKATPQQVKAQVWIALTSGADGLLYFVHQFAKPMNTRALLADQEMLAAVTAINRQITELAAVLNSPTPADQATVVAAEPQGSIRTLTKRHDGAWYIFAVNERPVATRATFALPAGMEGIREAKGLEGGRTVAIAGQAMHDTFDPYAVHLYILPAVPE